MLASRVLTWCVVGCLLAACGDSNKDAGTAGGGGGSASGGTGGSGGSAGASGGGPLGGGVEGIYTLDDVVQNTASCDPSGTSVRAGYAATHLVVRRTTIAGTAGDRQALVVTGCSGLAACRTLGAALVDDATVFELAPYSVFTSEAPAGTFSATTVFYGTLDGMTCRNGGIDRVSLSFTGAALTYETRTHRTDYPAVAGACSPSAAAEQGAAAPCTELLVLTGTRVETS